MDWIEINEFTTELDDDTQYWFRLEDMSEHDEPATTVKGTFKQYPWATHYATIDVVY